MPVFDRSAGTCVDKAIGTLGCRGLVGGRSHVVSIRRCPRRPMSRFAGRLRRSIRTCCRTLPVPCPQTTTCFSDLLFLAALGLHVSIISYSPWTKQVQREMPLKLERAIGGCLPMPFRIRIHVHVG